MRGSAKRIHKSRKVHHHRRVYRLQVVISFENGPMFKQNLCLKKTRAETARSCCYALAIFNSSYLLSRPPLFHFQQLGFNEFKNSRNLQVFSHNFESITICKNYFPTWKFCYRGLAWKFSFLMLIKSLQRGAGGRFLTSSVLNLPP